MLATRDIPLIYIVDAEESVRKGLSRLMGSMGMPSREFPSAEQFLAEMDPQQKACVLLDIMMPQLTGLQLQNELKKRKINLPIIAVSANRLKGLTFAKVFTSPLQRARRTCDLRVGNNSFAFIGGFRLWEKKGEHS